MLILIGLGAFPPSSHIVCLIGKCSAVRLEEMAGCARDKAVGSYCFLEFLKLILLLINVFYHCCPGHCCLYLVAFDIINGVILKINLEWFPNN